MGNQSMGHLFAIQLRSLQRISLKTTVNLEFRTVTCNVWDELSPLKSQWWVF